MARTRAPRRARVRTRYRGRTRRPSPRISARWVCTRPCTASSGSRGCSSPCSSTAGWDSARSPPGPTRSPAERRAYRGTGRRSRGPRRSIWTTGSRAGRRRLRQPRAYRRSCTAGGRSRSRSGATPPTSSFARREEERLSLRPVTHRSVRPTRSPSPRRRRRAPPGRARPVPRFPAPFSGACPPGTDRTRARCSRSGRRRAPASGTCATAGTPPRRTRTGAWSP